jgi:hypothetical protein
MIKSHLVGSDVLCAKGRCLFSPVPSMPISFQSILRLCIKTRNWPNTASSEAMWIVLLDLLSHCLGKRTFCTQSAQLERGDAKPLPWKVLLQLKHIRISSQLYILPCYQSTSFQTNLCTFTWEHLAIIYAWIRNFAQKQSMKSCMNLLCTYGQSKAKMLFLYWW